MLEHHVLATTSSRKHTEVVFVRLVRKQLQQRERLRVLLTVRQLLHVGELKQLSKDEYSWRRGRVRNQLRSGRTLGRLRHQQEGLQLCGEIGIQLHGSEVKSITRV